MYAHLKYFAHLKHSSPLWSSEKRPVQYTHSASSSVESSSKRTTRSVSESDGLSRRSWIPTNPPLPSFWRTKKSIRPKSNSFGFSGLFDFLFLSCPNKFTVKWTHYFLCCSNTITWLQVQAWHGADTWCSESLSRSERRKLTELNNVWSLVFIKAGWFTGAASVSSEVRGILRSEDVIVTRKTSCHPEAISRYFACCSSPVFIAELFSNLVDGDDSP